MRRRAIAIIASALMLTTTLATVAATSDDGVEVACTSLDQAPECEHASIQDAVDAADPGDRVKILPGTYEESVQVDADKEDLVLDGAGQNVTVLEGEDESGNGIRVLADGVLVQELTTQNFPSNGVYYDGVTGFYVQDVSAMDNGVYGIYAIRSEVGWVRDSFASGHSDSGFYIGEVLNCECVIENVHASNNLIGYSGTSASHIVIRDSTFQHNAAGVVPNVLPQETYAQTNLVIIDNDIRNNNNEWASETWHFSGIVHVPAGLGVVLAGGIDDLVAENRITGHTMAGVAIAWLFTEPSLNRVVDNTFDNGVPTPDETVEVFEDDAVDILWDGGGVNNCFEGNQRVDGDPVTFDAGPVFNTLGLPDCQTPNAGAPSPTSLAREGSLLVFHCEPGEHLEDEGHITDPDQCHHELSNL